MKLVFSEYQQDLENYIYSYAIWAYPERETPGDMFNAGFLISKKDLTRWYKTRSVRVAGPRFILSSENRRILKKGEGISFEIKKRADFDYEANIKKFCKEYADIRFGENIMDNKRLDDVFNSKCCSHVAVFKDENDNKEIGYIILYIEDKKMAYYYYAFYNLNYYSNNLGMYMMTSMVEYFAKSHFDYIYLGTCYTKNALYKTQFKGMEFHNGVTWSKDIKELKYLIKRQSEKITEHLLENQEYVEKYMQ